MDSQKTLTGRIAKRGLEGAHGVVEKKKRISGGRGQSPAPVKGLKAYNKAGSDPARRRTPASGPKNGKLDGKAKNNIRENDGKERSKRLAPQHAMRKKAAALSAKQERVPPPEEASTSRLPAPDLPANEYKGVERYLGQARFHDELERLHAMGVQYGIGLGIKALLRQLMDELESTGGMLGQRVAESASGPRAQQRRRDIEKCHRPFLVAAQEAGDRYYETLAVCEDAMGNPDKLLDPPADKMLPLQPPQELQLPIGLGLDLHVRGGAEDTLSCPFPRGCVPPINASVVPYTFAASEQAPASAMLCRYPYAPGTTIAGPPAPFAPSSSPIRPSDPRYVSSIDRKATPSSPMLLSDPAVPPHGMSWGGRATPVISETPQGRAVFRAAPE